MLLQIELQSETPIYEQLMQQIVEGIAAGQLSPGEQLPSVRSLAADLGINLHTVNKAYQLLKQDGYVHIHRKQGVVVHSGNTVPLDPAYPQRLQERMRPLVAEAMCRGFTAEQFVAVAEELFARFAEERGMQHE